MKTLWVFLGRVIYVFTYPILTFYLRGSKRTRVIVSSKDKVLLIRNWLGDGQWTLPGGGLHDGEALNVGASRELLEETGVVVSPGSFYDIGKEMARGFASSHELYFFETNLESTPDIKMQWEVAEYRWQDINDINGLRLDKYAQQKIQEWKINRGFDRI
ncbi:MAG: NUDIX hydrolase [Candidatus Saccharimonadales bacterium]